MMCPDILCRSCGGSGKELLPRVLIDVLSLWDLAGTWTASEAAAVLDSNATAINNRLEALRELGRCLRDALRAHDIAGRLGGDEFAVLLPATSVEQAISVAGRIVEQLTTQRAEGGRMPLGLSFGVVALSGDETLDEALRRADQALYEAKRQGRGRAVPAFGDEERPQFGESRPLDLTSS